MRFTGFDRDLLAFLKELRANNNRPWFEANKQRYERSVRGPTLAFIEAMAPRLERISPYIVAEASRSGGSMMRIYRDTRFSGDKTPYKTMVGVHFGHERAADVHCPAFWFHAEVDEVMMAAGIWKPGGEDLARIRGHIDTHQAQWAKVRSNRRLREVYGQVVGDALKRPPRPYTADHPFIDDIRKKEFLVVQTREPEYLFEPRLPEKVASAFAAAGALMKFLCDALGLEY